MPLTPKEKDALRAQAAAVKSQQQLATVKGYSDKIGPGTLTAACNSPEQTA